MTPVSLAPVALPARGTDMPGRAPKNSAGDPFESLLTHAADPQFEDRGHAIAKKVAKSPAKDQRVAARSSARRKRLVDVLSEVLRAVRLSGALYFEVNAAHPWVALTPAMSDIGAAMMPGAGHVIPFHIMITGHAWAMPEDRSVPPMSVDSGDVLMFPFGASHVISSDGKTWDTPPADLDLDERIRWPTSTPPAVCSTRRLASPGSARARRGSWGGCSTADRPWRSSPQAAARASATSSRP